MSTTTSTADPPIEVRAPWTMTVDIGSVSTRVAVSRLGRVESLDPDHHRSYLTIPSAVSLSPDGEVLVGAEAVRQLARDPERGERSPKPYIGEDSLLLGSQAVEVKRLVAALLRGVLARVEQIAGGEPAAELRLTHPAGWGPARTGVLAAAAELAGFARIRLIPDPVAAADHVARTLVHEGQLVAIYDLGAGRFSAGVLRRSGTGFELVGPPGGRDLIGGDDIDQRIATSLAAGPAGRHPDWAKLWQPPDADWRELSEAFGAEIRRAKEALSDHAAVEVAVPGLDFEVQLTKLELVELSRPVVEASLEALEETIADAGVTAADLTAVLLVGGSSRIPSVADAVWDRLHVRPAVEERGDEGGAVVLGAAGSLGASSNLGATVGGSGPASRFRTRLAAVPATTVWKRGADCYGYLDIEGQGVAVHAADEPARGPDVQACAAEAEQRLIDARSGYLESGLAPATVLGRQGGLERRFRLSGPHGQESWLERYLHDRGRWIVVRVAERAREVANALVLESSPEGDENRFSFDAIASVPEGWSVVERLELVRHESRQRVTAQGFSIAAGIDGNSWVNQQIAYFDALGAYVREEQTVGTFLGTNPAVIVRYRTDAGQVMRVWLGVIDGRGYRVLVTLPRAELGLPGPLSNQHLLVAHMVLRDHASRLSALTVKPTLKGLKGLPKRLGAQINLQPPKTGHGQ